MTYVDLRRLHAVPRALLALLLGLLALTSATAAPCATPEMRATGLLRPSKVILTPLGDALVAENGTAVINTGRVSIVGMDGTRRTLLDGLPSATVFVGDISGPSGLFLRGRTLYVVNGQGDVTLAGPVQGTEIPNPAPASPLFSSILAVHFSAAAERTTTGVALTADDHRDLAAGRTLIRLDAEGNRFEIALVVNFPDWAPDPRPFFAANVRHSHPYGVVANANHLFVVDAGFNAVRKTNLRTGEWETLVQFPNTPNPMPFGPPAIENVPTSIHWAGGKLLVTLLSGAPFLPGLSTVHEVDPDTGADELLVDGLSAAIDAMLIGPREGAGDLWTLEFSANLTAGAPGRLQVFPVSGGGPIALTTCLVTPTSMVHDPRDGSILVTEMATGKLLSFPLP